MKEITDMRNRFIVRLDLKMVQEKTVKFSSSNLKTQATWIFPTTRRYDLSAVPIVHFLGYYIHCWTMLVN